MNVTTQRWPILALLFIFLFSIAYSTPARGGAPAFLTDDEPPRGLFSSVDTQTRLYRDQASIRRENLVRVNWALLEGESGPAGPGAPLALNLFDDVVYYAVPERFQALPSGAYIWEGHLQGVEMSYVILVVDEGVMSGKVASPQGIYQIRYVGGELHAILEIDASGLQELEPIAVLPEATLAPFDLTAADDGSVIDMLVAYTDDARLAAGGVTAMQNEIRLAIAEANRAYANSGIAFRLALVFSGEVVYTETGNASTDLARLRQATPPFDVVHAWRNTYHADSVALVTQTGGCGLGYLMTWPNDATFHPYAFHVVNRQCLTGNMSLPHEHGHNMGSRHDWFVDDTAGSPYDYAHGFANLAGRWRTIMAYNDWCDCSDEVSPCPASGSRLTPGSPYCARLPYFSNPGVLYAGVPMGVAAGTSTACVLGSYTPDPGTCDADNRLTLNNHAGVTAGFRASQVTWTGQVSADWSDAGNWVRYEGPPGATNPVSHAPRAIDDVFIPAAPSGGRFPEIASGTFNVRELLIADGAQLSMTGGALNVYGDWEESGAGLFDATGGTVAFMGLFDQQIRANAASAFYHLQIGDGLSTQQVSLMSDLEVNGDLTIQSGASLQGGSYTLEVAGNWSDDGGGFDPGTGRLVLDGFLQTIDLLNPTSVLVDEDFSQFDGDCCTSGVPTGWRRQVVNGFGFAQGQLPGAANASANLWSDSTDGWLFSHAVWLAPGVSYELSYAYRAYYSSPGPMNYSIYLASAQDSGSTTELLSSVSTSATTYQTQTESFSVSTPGSYYLAFRAQKPSGTQYAMLDDIALSGSRSLRFYDLQVKSTSFAAPSEDMHVINDLTVDRLAVLHLEGAGLSVDGALYNNGTLRQVLDVPGGSQTRFLHIRNAEGDLDQYFGVDLTPSAAMGLTEVSVQGNQDECDGADLSVRRCFLINPESAQPATLRFWYLDSERNGVDPATAVIYHWDGAAWETLSMATVPSGSSGEYHWAEAVGVTSYSPFALAGPGGGLGAPTAVVLAGFYAEPLLGAMRLTWQTLLEVDLLGFNLYRAAGLEAERLKLNAELIPAQAFGGAGGGSYSYLDVGVPPGETWYWLEAVGVQPGGAPSSTLFDPLSVAAPYLLYAPFVSR